METCWKCDRPATHRKRRKNYGPVDTPGRWTYCCSEHIEKAQKSVMHETETLEGQREIL